MKNLYIQLIRLTLGFIGFLAILSFTSTEDDFASPTIVGATIAPNNSYLEVTFSEGVFNSAGNALSNAIGTEFALTYNDGGSGVTVTVSSIKQADGTTDPAGGETVLRFMLNVTGTPTGAETVEITPVDGNSVFDTGGANAMLAAQTTGAVALADEQAPSVTGMIWVDNTTLTVQFSENIDATTGNAHANYALDNSLTASAAVVSGSDVTLTVTDMSGLTEGTDITVTVTVVEDTNGNVVDAGNNTATTSVDRAVPGFNTLSVAANNSTATLTFTENVWNTANRTGAVDENDIEVTLASGTATLTSYTITHSAGSATATINLTLSGTPDGDEVLTVSPFTATDVFDGNGSAIPDATEITANLTDVTDPVFSSLVVANDNATATVTFSEPMYTNNDETGDLTDADFDVTLTGGAATLTSSSISHTAGSSTMTITLTLGGGTPDGNEVLTVSPSGDNRVFDAVGIDLPNAAEITANLNDKVAPTLASLTVASNNLSATLTFSEPVSNINNGSGALDQTDFNVQLTGGVATLDSYTITHSAGTNTATINLVLSGTPADGNELLTVTPTDGSSVFDLASPTGNAMSAAETINTNLNDNLPPTITGFTLDPSGGNAYVDIDFSEGVYASDAGKLSKNINTEFGFTFISNGGGATNVTVADIKQTDGSTDPAGGETTLRFLLNVTGTPTGVETIEITPLDGSSVYDQGGAANGNAMSAGQTSGVITLDDETPPTLDPDAIALFLNGGSAETLVMTFSETLDFIDGANVTGFTVSNGTIATAIYASSNNSITLTSSGNNQWSEATTAVSYSSGNIFDLNGLPFGDLTDFAVTEVPPATKGLGDIAITEINTSGNQDADYWVFVLLKDFQSGEIIRFTDDGWTGSGFKKDGSKSVEVIWTASQDYYAGTQIKVFASGDPANINNPEITVTQSRLSLSSTGDQIFAYQGAYSVPTFITAIDITGSWEAASNGISAQQSALPSALSAGSEYIQFNNQKGSYNLHLTGNDTGTQTELQTLLFNSSNWETTDGTLSNSHESTLPDFNLPPNIYTLYPGHLTNVASTLPGAGGVLQITFDYPVTQAATTGNDVTVDNVSDVSSEGPFNIGAGVTISGSTMTISGVTLEAGKTYRVNVAGSLLTDNSSGDLMRPITGTTSWEFTVENTAPTFVSASMESNNTYIIAEYSEGLYSENNQTGALTPADFNFSFDPGTGSANFSLTAIEDASGGSALGDNIIHFILTNAGGNPDGSETITISPIASEVYDQAGNPLDVGETTGAVPVFDKLKPQFILVPAPTVVSIDENNFYVDITFDEGVWSNAANDQILTTGDFTFNFVPGDLTDLTLDEVKKDNGTTAATATALTGGETTVRLFFSGQNGPPAGSETLEILAVNGEIFDDNGNSTDGTESTGVLVVEDTTPPDFFGTVTEVSNDYITVTFTEGIYAAAAMTGGVDISDFDLVYNNDDATPGLNVTFDGVTKTDGNATAGGENQLRFEITLTGGNPTGDGTITITPKDGLAGNFFDASDNPNSAGISIVATLQDNVPPTAPTVVWVSPFVNEDTQTDVQFRIQNGELGSTYNYTITSSGDGNTLQATGSGTVITADDLITGVNVLAPVDLPDGNLTLSVTLTDVSDNANTGPAGTPGVTRVLDTTDPIAFTTGNVVTSGGNNVADYWNSTNTGITVTVPIDNDVSLNNGTVQLEANVSSGGWENLGTSQTITIINSNLNIPINATTFEALSGGLQENETVEIRATITDAYGNPTIGGLSANVLTVDQVVPTAFTVANVVSTGGTNVSGYWNNTNTGLTISVPLDNDGTLVGGNIQIQARANAETLENIGTSVAIPTANVTQQVTRTAAEFEALSGGIIDGEIATFTAIVYDVAGNFTVGTESATTLTVDQTSPNAFSIPTVQARGGNEFLDYFNSTNTTFEVSVPIDADASLLGGNIQLVANVDATVFENLGGTPDPITVGSTTQVVSVLNTDVTALGGNLNPNTTYSIEVSAIIYDVAGNSTQGTSYATNIEYDVKAPLVTSITRSGPDALTNASDLGFDILFDEGVISLDAATDITIRTIDSPSGPISTGSINSLIQNTPSSYTANVTNVTGEGDVGLEIHVAPVAGIEKNADFTDFAGNPYSSDFTGGELYKVDNTPPSVEFYTPDRSTSAVPLAANIELVFSENVVPNSGFIQLWQSRVQGDILVESFDINTSPLVSQSNTTELDLFGAQNVSDILTINPTNNFDQDSVYYIVISNTVLLDGAGNSFNGITTINTPTDFKFKVYGEAKVTSVDAAACIDTELAIQGDDFSHYPGNQNGVTSVIFCEGDNCASANAKTSTSITYIDDSNITVTVPAEAPSGKILVVKGDQNALDYTGATFGTNLEITKISPTDVATGPSSAVISQPALAVTNVCDDGTLTTADIQIDIVGGSGSFTIVYDNGTSQNSFNNYGNGESRSVNPPVDGLNTYTLVSVTDNDPTLSVCSVPSNQLSGSVGITEWTRTKLDAGGSNLTTPGEIEVLLSNYPTGVLDFSDPVLMAGTTPSVDPSSDELGVEWTVENGPTSGGGSFANSPENDLQPVYTVTLPDAAFNVLTLRMESLPPSGANPCETDFDLLNVVFISDPKANPGTEQVLCENDVQAPVNALLSGGADGVNWSRDVTSSGTFPTVTAYSDLVTYNTGDVVENGGIWWEALQNGLLAITPTEGASWTAVGPWGFTTDGILFTETFYEEESLNLDVLYRPSPGELNDGEAFINAEPTIATVGQGSTSQLRVVITPNPITGISNVGPELVCLGDQNILYSVNDAATNSTYQWTIPGNSNISQVTGGNSNAIIVDINNNDPSPGLGNDNFGTTISVTETDINSGCSGLPFVFNVTMYDLPYAEFDPQLNHSDSPDTLYVLELQGLNDLDQIVTLPNGVEGNPPYVSFSGSGVSKRSEPGKDDVYVFDSENLPTIQHRVDYVYADDYGFGTQLGCVNTGFRMFNVFSSDNNIINLSSEYCEDFVYDVNLPLQPRLEANETLNRIYMIVNLNEVAPDNITTQPDQNYIDNIAQGFGLVYNTNTAEYFFDPRITTTRNFPAGQDYIEVKVAFEYFVDGQPTPQSRDQVVKIYKKPRLVDDNGRNVGWAFTYPDTEGFRVDINGNYYACDYDTLPGFEPVILSPAQFIIDYETEIPEIDDSEWIFVSNYDSINGTQSVYKQLDGNGDEVLDEDGNPIWKFDPRIIEMTGDDFAQSIDVRIWFRYRRELPGGNDIFCANQVSETVTVFRQPERPKLVDIGFGEDKICLTDSELTAEVANRATGYRRDIDGNVIDTVEVSQIAWWDSPGLVGQGDQAIESAGVTFTPTLASLDIGENLFYVAQRSNNLFNQCLSPPLTVNFEELSAFDFDVNIQCIDGVTPVEFTGSDPANPATVTDASDWEVIKLGVNDTLVMASDITVAEGMNQTLQTALDGSGLYQVTYRILSGFGCPATYSEKLVFNEIATVPGELQEDFDEVSIKDDAGWVSIYQSPYSGDLSVDADSLIWDHGVLVDLDVIENGIPVTKTDSLWGTRVNKNTYNTPEYSYRNTLNLDEVSYLYTSCYNFGELDKPMVAFDLLFDTQEGSDALMVEYTTDSVFDENTNWILIGGVENTLFTGIDWYNESGHEILQDVSDNDFGYGWSGMSKDMDDQGPVFKEVKHEIREAYQRDYVTLRFTFGNKSIQPGVYGDGFDNKQPDGFFIDNFFVGNRTRTVLVENFSNNDSDGGLPIKAENEALSDFYDVKELEQGATEVVIINYRTGFPNVLDEIYRDNSSEVSARSQFYGINSVPYSIMDGGIESGKGIWTSYGPLRYSKRTLRLSDIDISADVTVNNGLITVQPIVTPNVDIPANSVMHTVIVEKTVDVADIQSRYAGFDAFNTGETELEFVMKKMLPSASGHRFSAELPKDQTVAGIPSFTWGPTNIYDPSDLAVIIFIQDDSPNGTREVYQSFIQEIGPFNLATGLSDDPEAISEAIDLYPNPADNTTTLLMPFRAREDLSLMIYDNAGKLVSEETLHLGTNTTQINTSSLAIGVYQIRIMGKDGLKAMKKLVVSH